MEDIHDIKGVVPVPHSGWWMALGVLIVLAAIGFWWWRRRKGSVEASPLLPVLTPLERALAALQKLKQENPPVDTYYTRLSDIVRWFLEQQFHLRAPEYTTEEFLNVVTSRSQLAIEHRKLLAEFLQEADLVKFAKLRPLPSDQLRAADAAEKFMRESTATP